MRRAEGLRIVRSVKPDSASEAAERAAAAELDRIVRLIVEKFDPEKIVLFGSRAEGRAAPDSDADLLIVMRTSIPFWERGGAIRMALEHQELGLDLLVFTPEELDERADDPFSLAHEILKNGKLLHARSAA